MEGLKGARVWVTRPADRARALCFLLEDEGAEVTLLPMLEVEPPADERPLLAAVEQLRRFAWVAFASPAAVEAVVDTARRVGTLDALQTVKLAAVGPSTARALELLGLTVSLVAEPPNGAGLAARLLERLRPDEQVLVPGAEAGRRELAVALREAGASFLAVTAYRTEAAQVSLDGPSPDLVLFASPRTVEAFLSQGPSARETLESAKVVAIGPTTGAALERLGLSVASTARVPSDEGLVEAALQAWAARHT